MTRSSPLLAILLFLLLLNLVHTLENHTNRPRKRNSSATPSLIPREVYSSFNRTGAPIDHHNKTSDRNTGPTQSAASSDQPSVTTIIIIQSNGQTYHELGGGGPSPTDGGNGPNDGVNDPNESSIEAQVNHDNEVVKRMISISTVVGGVGVVMIIAGTVIFIRLRAKRRRLKAINHYSATPHSQDSGDDNHTDNGRHRRHCSSASNVTHLSQQHQHRSPASPVSLSSPTSATSTGGGYPHESIEMAAIRPSAPPEPTLLPLHLRERHQQSLLSQQQMPSVILPHISTSSSAPPAPSAPSAKELEMNLPSSTNPTTSRSSPVIEVTSPISPTKPTSHQFDTTHSSTLLQSSPSSSSSSSSSSSAAAVASGQPTSSSSASPLLSRAGPSLHMKPTAGSDGSDRPPTPDQHQPPLTPDIPPPAYTPSAPPLFILPPSQRRRSADQLSLDRYRR